VTERKKIDGRWFFRVRIGGTGAIDPTLTSGVDFRCDLQHIS
jgi:hypothetical protein